jgi:hypothetical protein
LKKILDGKTTPVYGSEELIMAILPKTIYRFSATPIKNPTSYLTEIKKKSFIKFIWKHKKPRIAKAFLRKTSMLGFLQYLTSIYTIEP